ncbi:MAG: hypothetical protein LBQ56_01750 [Synergistaceae bacterium]|jgi:hypothetical protein|nr:hypothetical protein [Synergistaceae bacterium]
MLNNWSWNASKFETVDRRNVKTGVSDGAWNVTVRRSGFSWGYCFILPDAAQSCILWNCTASVKGAAGRASPGIAFHDFERGVLFQMNEFEMTAELRVLSVNKEAIRRRIFKVSDVTYPYEINLEYNAVTSMCAGMINGERIFGLKLPHRGIPSIFEVDAVEIVTTTHSDEAQGSVEYGSMRLSCE